MPEVIATIAVPTLSADAALVECIHSLSRQEFRKFEIIVIDNSGEGRVRRSGAVLQQVRVIENERNVGFGAAVNQAFRESTAPYFGTLNDDAMACPGWLRQLVAVMEGDPQVGMCASSVRLAGEPLLDSAGMLICADGSSKQRGHGRPASQFGERTDALMPSGSAALFRRVMLEQIGLFDESFFLYCEDTDLGLRARRAGWSCRYVPEGVVEHRYSHSAGRVSPLKAYYVERNRLAVAVKNFPARLLWRAPVAALERYVWHVLSIAQGRGAAGQFVQQGNGAPALVYMVLRAHFALLARLRVLWRQRQEIRRSAKLTDQQFLSLLREYEISPREVAAL